MNCVRCGEICSCEGEAFPAALHRQDGKANQNLALEEQPSDALMKRLPSEPTSPSPSAAGDENDSAWRDELTAKLSRYRARRKPRPPRYPSLGLRFEATISTVTAGEAASSPMFEIQSRQALALDQMTELPASTEAEWESQADRESSSRESRGSRSHEEAGNARETPRTNSGQGATIIEFPRSADFDRWEFERWSPAPPGNELAGPVMAAPRILEVPEAVLPAPALGGITIEVSERVEDRRPGIDVPLQSAPLARRMAAAAIDGLIVALATALFGTIFWKITSIRPPRFQILGMAVASACFFWTGYQYLLQVYGATTSGLLVAGLKLSRFDGTLPNRRQRRWRVLASYLAAASLGMGYLWVLLDEDALCWHDRITHSYLAPKKRPD